MHEPSVCLSPPVPQSICLFCPSLLCVDLLASKHTCYLQAELSNEPLSPAILYQQTSCIECVQLEASSSVYAIGVVFVLLCNLQELMLLAWWGLLIRVDILLPFTDKTKDRFYKSGQDDMCSGHVDDSRGGCTVQRKRKEREIEGRGVKMQSRLPIGNTHNQAAAGALRDHTGVTQSWAAGNWLIGRGSG
jgi:hypothetical protein